MNILPKFNKILIISDDTHRQQQSIALAHALEMPYEVHSAGEVNIDFSPEIIIGTGYQTSQDILDIRALTGAYSISILEPKTQHDKFDLIIVPSYEPHYQAQNVMTTIGLLNKVNDDFTVQPEDNQFGLKPPYISMLIGGNYIGGRFIAQDIIKLCEDANLLAERNNASLLITTSMRTNQQMIQNIRDNIAQPYFLYDYKKDRHINNPYQKMLGLADEIIVTGDSIRMCSEACTTDKKVHIFLPNHDFLPYQNLYVQLQEHSNAKILDGEELNKPQNKEFNEAGRISDYVKIDLIGKCLYN